MDLRQFTHTPTYEQQQQQGLRRPSISSMSSASGYASPTYGGGTSVNAIHPNTTGNSLLSSRVNQSRHFANGTSGNIQTTPTSNSNNLLNNQNLLFNSTWLPQQNINSMLNVTPWIEQQAQVSPLVNTAPSPNAISMQALNMSSLPSAENISPNEQANFNIPLQSDDEGKLDKLEDDERKESQRPKDSSTINDSETIDNNIDDDDLIPTAIVIKNIPFAIKKEQLLDVMTKLNLPLPYAFNYHFDNGVFRGLAFANFTSTDETTLVVTQLNGREIGGRKLRVEYKKMLPVQERERIEREKREKRGQLEEQHRSTSATSLASLYSIASAPASGAKLNQSNSIVSNNTGTVVPDRLYANLSGLSVPSTLDFNDPDTLELYSQFLLFRDDKDRSHSELAYSSTLLPNQRKVIPILLNYLKLTDSYENGLIILRRKATVNSPNQSYSQQHPLLRSQSHNSLGLLSQLSQSLQNSRYRTSSGVPLPPSLTNLPPQSQQPTQQHQMKTNFMNKSSSNLASLRNPTIQQQQSQSQSQTQQSQSQSQSQLQPQQQQSQQLPQHPMSQHSPYISSNNGFMSQSMMTSQGQPLYQQPHHYQQQQPQQFSFGYQQQQPQQHQQQHHHQQQQPQHKGYLDESLIASVENLTFN